MAAIEDTRLIENLLAAHGRQVDKLFDAFFANLASGLDRNKAAQDFANGLGIASEALHAALYIIQARTAALGDVNVKDSARYDNNPRS